MGFANSWIAIQGKSREAVLAELRLREVGSPEPFSEWPMGGAELPHGWYLIFLDDVTHAFTEEVVLSKLSQGCLVVACQFHEGVMVSAAFAYRDGQKEWDVTHDSDLQRTHLEEFGTLPDCYASIREDLLAKQNAGDQSGQGVDYVWDIPVALAYEIVGFRHDQVELREGGEPEFVELVMQ